MNNQSAFYPKFLDEISKMDYRNNMIIILPKTKYKTYPLKEIVQFREEKIEPFANPIKKFNLISVLDVNINSINLSYNTFIGAKILSQKLIIKEGDVLVSRINPRKNRVAIAPENKNGNLLICSTEFYALYNKYNEKDEKFVYPKFLAFFLKTDYAKKQMLNKPSGLTPSRSRITETSFENVLIPLPKPSEQLEIIKYMEEKEKYILIKHKELKEKKIEFSQQRKKWGNIEISNIKKLNFYHVYPDILEKRIDFIANNPEIIKNISFIKKHNHTELNNLLESDFEYGLNDFGKEKGKIPFINIENLTSFGKILFNGIRFIDKCNEEKLLRDCDILISRSRNVGVCALFKGTNKATFGSYILRFRVKDIDPFYIVYFLNSEFGQQQILYLKTGSTGSNINPNQLKKIAVLINNNDAISQEFNKIIFEIEKLIDIVLKKEKDFFSDFQNFLTI